MLECPKCRIKYEEGKKYCKNCGTPLEESSTESEKTSFCCSKCGMEYEEGKRFCKNCGAVLTLLATSAKERPVPSSKERPVPSSKGRMDFIPHEKVRQKAQIKAWIKEGIRLSKEKSKLESLLVNIETQRDITPAALFEETQGRYTQQLGVINKRLQELETTSWQAGNQIDSEIRALEKEIEPLKTNYASLRSLYKTGGMVGRDFRQSKKGPKKQISIREKQLRKKRRLLKMISSRLSPEGFIPQPVWYKTRLARFALIWPSICLGALLAFGASYYITAGYLGWWLPFSSPPSSSSPTVIASKAGSLPPKVKANPETGKSPLLRESLPVPTETDPIKKVFEDIKAANIKKDITLFLSCYSPNYPELAARKEATLKNWKSFDFIDLVYDLKEKNVQGDEARITVEWTTKTISKEDSQLHDAKSLLTVLLRKEEGAWKILQTQSVK